jgi:putative transposase
VSVIEFRRDNPVSIRRLALVFDEAVSTVGRWVGPKHLIEPKKRFCPVSGDAYLRSKVWQLCHQPRHLMFGYRRIWAMLRRCGWSVNKKTVWRIMHDMALCRPKVWHRPWRPKRVERMRPSQPNRGWQIDMTCFVLSDMSMAYLVGVVDCCTRQIVGWTLSRRARAVEWASAVRMALESQELTSKDDCCGLVLRSDNGAQPCSKKFVEFLGKVGVKGQYTGYDSPDDNAYIERLFRTVKEEEIWPNEYESFAEAHKAIEDYVRYYNEERVHSALDYQTPNEAAAAFNTLAAA